METNECSICLENIDITVTKENPIKRIINNIRRRKVQPVTTICNHTFHKRCLVKWKKNKYNGSYNLCPICRTELFDKYKYKYLLAVAQVDKNIPTGNVIRLPVETLHKMNKCEFNMILAAEQMVVIKIISCKKIKISELTEEELQIEQEEEDGLLLY